MTTKGIRIGQHNKCVTQAPAMGSQTTGNDAAIEACKTISAVAHQPTKKSHLTCMPLTGKKFRDHLFRSFLFAAVVSFASKAHREDILKITGLTEFSGKTSNPEIRLKGYLVSKLSGTAPIG
jgi:hypothetical protein